MRPWISELWMLLWLFYFLPGVTFGEDTVLEIIDRPTRKWRAWKIWEGDGFFQKESYLPGVIFEVQGCGLRWWNWGVSSFNLIRWPCIEFLRAKILWSQNPWLQKIKNGQVSHSVIFSFGESFHFEPPAKHKYMMNICIISPFHPVFQRACTLFSSPRSRISQGFGSSICRCPGNLLEFITFAQGTFLERWEGGTQGDRQVEEVRWLTWRISLLLWGSGERGGRHLWCFWQKKITLLKGPMICRHSSEIQLNDIVDPWQMKQ